MQLEFNNKLCSQCHECIELCPSGALNLPFVDGYLHGTKANVMAVKSVKIFVWKVLLNANGNTY